MAPENLQQSQIPDHLLEGWQIYQMWRQAREAAGDPLPPGMVFILNRTTVLQDGLSTLKMRLCERLGLEPGFVTVDVEHNPVTGRIGPTIDVSPPVKWLSSWRPPPGTPPGQDVAELAQRYITAEIERAHEEFSADMMVRLQQLDGRADLMPREVEDALLECEPASRVDED